MHVRAIDLHISAGGVRGLAIANMFKHLPHKSRLRTDLLDPEDHEAAVHCTGVSVGAILTLALASSTPEAALDLFCSIAASTHVVQRTHAAMVANVFNWVTCGVVNPPRVRDIMRELTPSGSNHLLGDVSPKYKGSAVSFCTVETDGVTQVNVELVQGEIKDNLQHVRDSAAVPYVPRAPVVGTHIDGAAASILSKQRIVDSLSSNELSAIIVVSCRPWVRRLDWNLHSKTAPSHLHDAKRGVGEQDDGLFHMRACTKSHEGDCFTTCHGQQIINQYMTMACLFDMIAIQRTLGIEDSHEIEGVELLYRCNGKTYRERKAAADSAGSGRITPLLLIAPYQNRDTMETAIDSLNRRPEQLEQGHSPTFGLYGNYNGATLTHCTREHRDAMEEAGVLLAAIASMKYDQALRDSGQE